MPRRRRHVTHREICQADIVRRDPRREQRHRHEDYDDDEADDAKTRHKSRLATETPRKSKYKPLMNTDRHRLELLTSYPWKSVLICGQCSSPPGLCGKFMKP